MSHMSHHGFIYYEFETLPRTSIRRTREPPPFLRLEYDARAPDSIRSSLVPPPEDGGEGELNYNKHHIPWNSHKQKFEPLYVGRSASTMERKQYQYFFIMKDEYISKVSVSFELKHGPGGELSVELMNHGSQNITYHSEGRQDKLAPKARRILKDDDTLEFVSSKGPFLVRCDMRLEPLPNTDPLRVGFTAVVEESSRGLIEVAGRLPTGRMPRMPLQESGGFDLPVLDEDSMEG